MLRRAIVLLVAICSVAHASNTPQTGSFHGCPVRANSGDRDLNALKNRTSQAINPRPITFAQIQHLQRPSVVTAVHRSRWQDDDLTLAAAQERRGVVLTGNLIAIRRQSPEKTNCDSPTWRDFHVWIAPTSRSAKVSAVVVEVTPPWQEVNPNWNLPTFRALARIGAKVRVTGWLMWDQDHGSEVGRSRATLWEIHPITKIEFVKNGRWTEL